MGTTPEIDSSGLSQTEQEQIGSDLESAPNDIQQLSELIEQLAAEAVAVDADDLTMLASMHSQLLSLQQRAEQLPDNAPGDARQIGPIASETGQLIERLILRQTDDAASCLQHISQEITQLQQLVNSTQGNVPAPCPTDNPTPLPAPNAGQADGLTKAEEHPQAQENAAPTPSEALPEEAVINSDDAPLVAEFISEARGHIETAEAELLKLEEQPDDPETLNAVFRSFHTIKGVAGFLNLRQIGALAHVAENLLDLARRAELKLCGVAVDLVLEAIDQMKLLIADLDIALRQGRAMETQPDLPSLLDRLRACAAGAQVPDNQKNATKSAAPKAPQDEAKGETRSKTAGNVVADATVKVATDRLDNLINMVGELVIAESMVRQDVASLIGSDQRVSRDSSHLNKITRALQELSMSMRMVPIQAVFQKMARLVRDLGHKALKQIEFSTEGGETELDRNVVEAISDPLVHMVRNSVDHGVETPEERQKAGKAPTGYVRLRAFHQAGNIVIQISDDGRGLNKAKILKKAVEAGIVQPEQSLSEQEIFQLIFHAGLSTADKITDVSGRGVGMDVVRKNIEALRGRIEIASTEGKGTTITIRLPLTLAVIDGLVIKVGDNRYILPMTGIEQSLRPTPDQISTVQERGEVCHMRGSLLPLFRLHRLFRIQPVTEDPTKALVVIVQDNQRRCCVLVDELLGQQQVVIKSLGDLVGKVPGVCGGAILGDGNVSMILDIPGLIDLALADGAASMLAS